MNNEQLIFIAAAIIMALFTLYFVALPLFRNKNNNNSEHTNQADAALDVLREQLDELESEHYLTARDPETMSAHKAELELRALQEGTEVAANADYSPSRLWAASSAAFIVAATVIGYMAWGEPTAITTANTVSIQQQMAALDSEEAIKQMVNSMANRLNAESGTPQEWAMLARSYIVLAEYENAVQAFNKLDPAQVPDAGVLADWAEAIALQHAQITPDSEAMAFNALKIDNNHIKALLIVGTAAYERQDYVNAVAYWKKVIDQTPEGEMMPLRTIYDHAVAEAAQQAQ